MSTFKRGDRVRVLPTFRGGRELVGKEGVVLAKPVVGDYDVVATLAGETTDTSFYADELESLDSVVTYIHAEPQIAIDLKKLNPMYTTPLVLTIEQATLLLRELDQVIL